MPDSPDLRRYVVELTEMLAQRDPAAYRAFIQRWRELHQRGAAERLLSMDDASLRLRIERMILETAALADLHEPARAYLEEHRGATGASEPNAPRIRPRRETRRAAGTVPPSDRGGGRTLRLRKRPRSSDAGASPEESND